MAERRRNLVIPTTPGAERQAWCDRCLTSAAVEVDIYAFFADSVGSLGTFHVCTQCDKDKFLDT